MYQVVFIRHGHSVSNEQNLFTGWDDVDLTAKGEQEARDYAKLLAAKGFEFDIAFTSVLKRAIRTLWITLDETNQMWIPVVKDWRLNEKHSGALTGLNKAEAADKFGKDQVYQWINGYDSPPPPLADNSPYMPHGDRRYTAQALPATESLKQAISRVSQCWDDQIAPQVSNGKQVLVVAHRNILRGLFKHLGQLSDDALLTLDIANSKPIIAKFDEAVGLLDWDYL